MRPSFPVVVALLVLCLSLAYTLLFGRMVFDSLMEQVIFPHWHLPRYAGLPHSHNLVEWVLLVFPLLISLVGVVGSLGYLMRRRPRANRLPFSPGERVGS